MSYIRLFVRGLTYLLHRDMSDTTTVVTIPFGEVVSPITRSISAILQIADTLTHHNRAMLMVGSYFLPKLSHQDALSIFDRRLLKVLVIVIYWQRTKRNIFDSIRQIQKRPMYGCVTFFPCLER